MCDLGLLCPDLTTNSWDWSDLDHRFECIRNLHDCPQEPRYHGEGDVWIHTKMSVETLLGLEKYQKLSPEERQITATAVLLHDIGKPATTKDIDGRLSTRGHAGAGEIMARRLLWELGVPIGKREQIAQLIRYHALPGFLINSDEFRSRTIFLSQLMNCEILSILSEADIRGRICEDQQKILDNIALFREQCSELDCLYLPFHFRNDTSRFEFFRHPSRDPFYQAHDSTRGHLILLSGLPGAGKDHWVRQKAQDCTVISLDDIRSEIGAPPTGKQSEVVHHARNLLRKALRAGETVIWNATNLSRVLRKNLIDLAVQYNARISVEYIETIPDILHRQNRARKDYLPEKAYEKMFKRWQVPDRTEAHTVHWNGQSASYE